MSFVALQTRRTVLFRHATHRTLRLVAVPVARFMATSASEEKFAHLKVNESRLMKTLHETCEWGKAHKYGAHEHQTGMARLSLNKDDKSVRDWLAKEVESLGCKLTVDEMGNMFAVRPGKNADKPAIMMGSHYDTQPTGGRYDGILGMTAGLEVLRVLHENNYETENPIGLINWTNEEGARFPMTTMGSSVWAGTVPLQQAHDCPEVSSLAPTPTLRTVKEELEAISYLGPTPAHHSSNPIAAHFELHIEQGPILEDEKLKLGVVTGGQAYSWFEVTISGKDSHAGTTPMRARSDSLVTACKLIGKMRTHGIENDALVTVGIMNALPGSINTIPKSVKFTVDIRHPSANKVLKVRNAIKRDIHRNIRWLNEKGGKFSFEWKTLTEYSAVEFDEGCIQAVEDAAEAVTGELKGAKEDGRKLWKRMLSGAGHDSCQTSKIVPTAMIFTPTRDGMSHTPDEFCSAKDCALGAQALLGAVLRYDVRKESLDKKKLEGESTTVSEEAQEDAAERAEIVQGEDLKSDVSEDFKAQVEGERGKEGSKAKFVE